MDDKTQLIMLYENIYYLMIKKDTSNLVEVMGEEFALHHMMGMIQKKDAICKVKAI